MSEDMVVVRGLRMTIGSREILRGIDLDVAAGRALALVGESGSGKSMTLRALLGLAPPRSRVDGMISIDGVDPAELTERRARRWRADTVGMIFQDPRAHVNPVRSIGDFLTEQLTSVRGVARSDAAARAITAMRDVGIRDPEERMAQYPHQLSGGLLQRVMIASVLLADTALVLADEPTTALDVSTQEEVVAILDERRREHGMALVFVSHDLNLAAAITDRTAVMRAGEIVEVAPSRTLHRDAVNAYTRALFAARPSLDGLFEEELDVS